MSGNGADGVTLMQSTAEVSGCVMFGNVHNGLTVGTTSAVTLHRCNVSHNGGTGIAVADFSNVVIGDSILGSNSNSGLTLGNSSSAIMEGGAIVGNSAPDRQPSNGAGVYCVQNSSVTLDSVRVEANAALHEGGGVYFHGETGGSMYLSRSTIRGNSALSFGGGVRAVNSFPLVGTLHYAPPAANDFFLIPVFNGTHLFAFTADCVLNSVSLAPGRAYGRFALLSGHSGTCATQNGRQNQSALGLGPAYPGLDMRGALSADGRHIYTTAVLRNYQLQYSPMRVVDSLTGDASTLALVDAELGTTLAAQQRAVSCIQASAALCAWQASRRRRC